MCFNPLSLDLDKKIDSNSPKYTPGLLSLPNNVWRLIVFAPFLLIIFYRFNDKCK